MNQDTQIELSVQQKHFLGSMRFVLEDRLGSERPSVIGVTDNAKGHAARELVAEFRGRNSNHCVAPEIRRTTVD